MHILLTREASGPPVHHARQCGRRGFAALAMVMLSLGLINPAMTQPSLTLQAALDAAQARSATLQAQHAAARAAREMAVATGQLPDPVLRLAVDNLPIEGSGRYSLTDDFMTMRSVGLAQTFTGSEKRQARSARYEREADAALATRSTLLARLRTQTARAWFERYFLERMLELLQRQREETVSISAGVESAYRGGRSPLADVLSARAAIARIDDRLHEVRADLDNARALLQRWVGDAGSKPLGAPPKIDSTRLAEHALAHEIDQHPDIALMNAREHVALATAEVARQEKSADWSWSVMYSKRGSVFGDMVSLGVSIPLQWDQAGRQDRELAARLEQVEQVRSEREEMRREHLFDLQRLLANWRSSLRRLADYDNTLIPLATERVDAVSAAFRGGKASLAAVLEARRMVTDIALDRLRIERQTAAWWAELTFLIPEDLPAHAAAPTPSDQPAREPMP
ncbi:TolC family protein [Methyloversatilis sp. XJ19-13]|uniref:TolC family protein n=1 Tax=Methyloversatilis sp. XJ19-13 TaxID=2963430 RepID=UPI00211BFBE5|nr:TolC family protein [Methyloversatilis sp. XJ19-13]MCQ9374782.1 TolC family protein [Methyloversatilis sp. XJ19-13]